MAPCQGREDHRFAQAKHTVPFHTTPGRGGGVVPKGPDGVHVLHLHGRHVRQHHPGPEPRAAPTHTLDPDFLCAMMFACHPRANIAFVSILFKPGWPEIHQQQNNVLIHTDSAKHRFPHRIVVLDM